MRALWCALVAAVACARPAGHSEPTVVVVILDTARADRLPPWGGDTSTAPALADLARDARVYDAAYASAPWTLPSHASLFTGLPVHEHGCDHATLRFDGRAPLLAERLSKAGYATAAFTNNPWITESTGLASGFDVFVEVFRRSLASGRAITRFLAPEATGIEDAGAARAVASFDRWLDSVEGRPAFGFVNLIEAHLPYEPPPGARGRLRGASLPTGTIHAVNEEWLRGAHAGRIDDALRPDVLGLYDEELRYLDDQLARLVESLRTHGRLDEALLIVASDHGEAFATARVGDVWLVDHQLSIRDELLHVPLLVRWPDHVPPGRHAGPVGLEDVFGLATFAAGLDPGPPRLLAEEPDRVLTASYGVTASHKVVLEHYLGAGPVADALSDRGLRAVRRGRFKLVAASGEDPGLFDVASDPDELEDVAARFPEVVAGLAPLLPPEPASASVAPPDAALEALRALGYVEER